MNNSYKTKNLVLMVAMTLTLSSCSKDAREEVKDKQDHHDEVNIVELTEAQIKNAGLELGLVEEKQISGTIKVNGILDVPPQQLVSISAPMGGFLKTTTLLEGSRVKKGQSVATIENLDFIQMQQDYLEAKSSFEFAKADYDRQQTLAKENVNSEKTVQQAKSNYSSWLSKYNGLQEKLKLLNFNIPSIEQGNIKSSINLYSPIDGYVTEVNVNIGKYVSPTDVLFEIVDTEHLHAELIVFEKDVPKLQIDQKVRFTLANETVERLATVYLIGREINEDRTIQIHCHIDKEDKELLPGMYLYAMVETGGAKVAALPDEAIIDYQGKRYIFIVDESTSDNHTEEKVGTKHFKMIEMETGDSELGYTEIKVADDIKLMKSQVVIKGAYALLSKIKNSEEDEGHAH